MSEVEARRSERPWRSVWLAFVALVALGSQGCCGPGSDGTKTWPGPFDSVTTSADATCGMKAGVLTCWGTSGAVEVHPPRGVTFRRLSLDNTCAVGLDASGTLVSWGKWARPCETPPAGRYVEVSAEFESCAIRQGGDLVCWQQSTSWSVVGGSSWVVPPPPPRVTRGPFERVSVSHHGGCAIRADGSLHCWELCHQDRISVACPPAVPPPSGTWADVVTGRDHSCALSPSGTIACWGDASHTPGPSPTGAGHKAIATHGQTACAIDAASQIVCWGAPITWLHRTYLPPPGPFVGLAVGDNHVCGLRPDGRLSCWGTDQQAQISGKKFLFAG